jgi:hypothetical protein
MGRLNPFGPTPIHPAGQPPNRARVRFLRSPACQWLLTPRSDSFAGGWAPCRQLLLLPRNNPPRCASPMPSPLLRLNRRLCRQLNTGRGCATTSSVSCAIYSSSRSPSFPGGLHTVPMPDCWTGRVFCGRRRVGTAPCVYKNLGQPLWPARSPSRPLHTETVAATVPKPAAPSQPTREIRREGPPRDILCKRSTQSSVRCPWDSSDLEEAGRGRATRNLSPRSSESLTVPRAPPRAAGGDLQPVNHGINAARVFALPFDRYICSELGFEPPWCAGFTRRRWLRRAVLRHRVSRSELGKGCGSRWSGKGRARLNLVVLIREEDPGRWSAHGRRQIGCGCFKSVAVGAWSGGQRLVPVRFE